MKDFFGFDLKVHDTVADTLNSRSLSKLEIIDIIDDCHIMIKDINGVLIKKNACDTVKQIMTPDDLKLVKFAIGAEQ